MSKAHYRVEEIQLPVHMSRGGSQLWGVFRVQQVARVDNVMTAERIAKLLNEDERKQT